MIMPRFRDKNGVFRNNPPPYYCIKCGIKLNDDNWYDSKRKTNHGRVFICKTCWKKIIKENREKRMNVLRNEWNDICCICGMSYDTMMFHEINWIRHPLGVIFYEKNKERFIYVCKKCHIMLHQLYNIAGLELEEMPIWYSIRKGIKI